MHGVLCGLYTLVRSAMRTISECLVDHAQSKFCTLNFLTRPISVAFFNRISKYLKILLKNVSYWQTVQSNLTACILPACSRSDCVGVNIIIYFFVFNLTTCSLKTMPWLWPCDRWCKCVQDPSILTLRHDTVAEVTVWPVSGHNTNNEYNLFYQKLDAEYVLFNNFFENSRIFWENNEKLFWRHIWRFFRERRCLVPKINITFFIANWVLNILLFSILFKKSCIFWEDGKKLFLGAQVSLEGNGVGLRKWI